MKENRQRSAMYYSQVTTPRHVRLCWWWMGSKSRLAFFFISVETPKTYFRVNHRAIRFGLYNLKKTKQKILGNSLRPTRGEKIENSKVIWKESIKMPSSFEIKKKRFCVCVELANNPSTKPLTINKKWNGTGLEKAMRTGRKKCLKKNRVEPLLQFDALAVWVLLSIEAFFFVHLLLKFVCRKTIGTKTN